MMYTAAEEQLYIPVPVYMTMEQFRQWEREWIRQHPDYRPQELKDAILKAFPPK